MNDLYLIGNGFDLAHGLKTSYNDFLLWYLKANISMISPNGITEDKLIKIIRPSGISLNNHLSISDLLNECDKYNIKIECKHLFFEKLVRNYYDYKWVDIEYEYYMDLVRLYKEIELNPQLKDSIVKRVNELNLCFDSIKEKLVGYLKTIQISELSRHMLIGDILRHGTGIEGKDEGDRLFLCFNYTSTLELYTKEFYFPKHGLINIHGKLIDEYNPIVFGYGDEMDPHYEKIENLNSNEFLKNIKSFGYFRTSNYQRINSFIEGESKEFTIKILGHSCGLSDRILLNTVFEHPNCKAIKIYYYQKSETENDYFEKTQEISRHFKASGKGDMRRKIVPFDQCIPLVPFISKS